MTRVTEINNLDDLVPFRMHWNSLLPQTRGATFFQSFEWLETYWRHYGDRQRLRVLIVSSDDRPIGILPLTVIRERTRLGTVRVLTYPLDGWGTFYVPIGPNPTATLWAGLKHIQATPRYWDLADLRWIDADGSDAGRTGNAMNAAGMTATATPLVEAAQIELGVPGAKPQACPSGAATGARFFLPQPPGDQIDLGLAQGPLSPFAPAKVAQLSRERKATLAADVETNGWNAYWSTRKARWRQNVARAERRLAQCGEVTYIRYRPEGSRNGDGDPRWDLYDVCETIARRSWQGTAADGTTLSHESVRDYLRDAHETAAAAGGLDLNLLLVAGQPAAFAYNNHYRGSIYGVRTGFDPAVTSEGAGSVLLRHMIEDSFSRGDHLIDLGPGSLEAKRHWATRIQTSYHYPYYAPLRMKAQALRMKRWLVGARG